MYRQYHAIACISGAVQDSLRSWIPETERKLRLCPNGINTAKFSAQTGRKKETFGVSKENVILSVGRLQPGKGHDVTMRALALVPEAHLFLAGSGPELEELRGLAADLGIANRVHFLGIRNDIDRLMTSADVLVQASRWEGFGIAALEALAAEVPVIASRVPGLSDVIGDAGLLFEVGDHKALAAHIENVLSNPDLRNSLKHKGRIRAVEFDIERTVDCYEALYREACCA